MSWLTRDVRDRPIWMMGLIFMIPAGAMFFTAMFLEFRTGAMTPATSRKPQVIVAIVATILTFAVGCICDAIYLYGGFIRDAGVKFIFAIDRGDTIDWDAYDEENSPTRGDELNSCANELLAKMPKYTDVGLITYSWQPLETFAFSKADDAYKAAFPDLITARGDEGVSYINTLNAAISLSEQDTKKLPTRILLFTGGDEAVYLLDDNGDVHSSISENDNELGYILSSPEARAQIIQQLKDAGCTLYVISPTGQISESLQEVVTETGGISVSIEEAAVTPEFVSIITVDGDMLRSSSRSAKILSLIMLLLEGLGIGICISIMLSTVGQKRFQMILSPLMGALSFVLVKLIGTPDSNPLGLWWLWEGLSFLPLGLIFMKKNIIQKQSFTGGSETAPSQPMDSWGGSFGTGGSSSFGNNFGGTSSSSSFSSGSSWGTGFDNSAKW